MTNLLHVLGDDAFDDRLQRARLRYVCESEAAARSLAENYVGLRRLLIARASALRTTLATS